MSFSVIALVQTLLNGALLGCLFGTIALGMTIKWGYLGVADFFHLSLTLLGAYATYTLVTELRLDPFLSIALTVPLFFLVGVGVQRVFHLLNADPFTMLLLTFALFIVVQSTVSLVWSPDLLSLRPYLPDSFTGSLRLPGPFKLVVAPVDLVALAWAVGLVGATAYTLRRTRWGRALKAMRQDPAIAETLGVRVLPVALVVSGLAAATAALAGMVLALRMPLSPTLPLNWIGIVVVATLLGRLGNPLGALIAAAVLMMAQNAWSLWFPPQWAPAVTYGILFALLAAQPLARVARERLTSRSPA
ncbi:branched-chain amino acid ABC transporter permease (plasmid) [Embleya sp. NBC_00888]|uniref:branched-chain amino acid ABC transporter permease n=1 Tax=Embleya sp. NBC_00888 TaxID=2975960 RepID=UPI002F913EED|nr:branched-chain amino acid ABC transporter permease [Embleya sp. NBC_00888]